jgi:hypothetical protein
VFCHSKRYRLTLTTRPPARRSYSYFCVPFRPIQNSGNSGSNDIYNCCCRILHLLLSAALSLTQLRLTQTTVDVFVAAKNKHVAYGSLYLTVPGVYAAAPILSAWMANNSEPYYRRATSIAFGFIATNAVGLQKFVMDVSVLTLVGLSLGRNLEYVEFPDQRRTALHEDDDHEFDLVSICLYFAVLADADDFRLSSIVIVLGSLLNAILLSHMNTSKRQRRAEILAPYVDENEKNSDSDGGMRAWMELGDKHPDFRYTL